MYIAKFLKVNEIASRDHDPEQGRIQGFPKGGVETRDTKCGGGGGVLSASGPIRKAGGGGGGGVLSIKGPIRKAEGGGGGGGGGMLSGASGPIQNAGKGGGGGAV